MDTKKPLLVPIFTIILAGGDRSSASATITITMCAVADE